MKVRKLDSSGDMIFGRGPSAFLHDGDAVVQSAYTRLKLNRGEWFLDMAQGVRWGNQPEGQPAILDNPFDRGLAETELKSNILGGDGVARIEEFDYAFDANLREASGHAIIVTDYATIGDVVVRTDQ